MDLSQEAGLRLVPPLILPTRRLVLRPLGDEDWREDSEHLAFFWKM
jgi:hypothetical protein